MIYINKKIYKYKLFYIYKKMYFIVNNKYKNKLAIKIIQKII
jgi:hypothetical protein